MNRWLLKVEKYSPMSLHLKWFKGFLAIFRWMAKGRCHTKYLMEHAESVDWLASKEFFVFLIFGDIETHNSDLNSG